MSENTSNTSENKSENKSPKELIEKIKDDMRKSGFPLEFYVLNVCAPKTIAQWPSLRYEYNNQSRELDLLALFAHSADDPVSDPSLQRTSTRLVIECKKRAGTP
jgi:hypothetical protein